MKKFNMLGGEPKIESGINIGKIRPGEESRIEDIEEIIEKELPALTREQAGPEEAILAKDREITKPLSEKIDEYEDRLEEVKWFNTIEKRRLENILKALKSIQELAVFKNKLIPTKIEKLSGIEDLKELYGVLKQRLQVEDKKDKLLEEKEPMIEKEIETIEPVVPSEQAVLKDEILNILDKKDGKNQKREEGLKAIIDSINNKIEKFKIEKKNTSILRYKKRKEIEVILIYLEAMRQSIAEDGTVRPDLLYRIEKIEGLNDLYKSISSERSIEKCFFPRSRQKA